MIAEAGLAALWLAAALAAIEVVIGLGWRKLAGLTAADHRPMLMARALLGLVALGALILLFLGSDLDIALVARTSHESLGGFAKVGRAIGSTQGALLLGIAALGLAGAVLAKVGGDAGDRSPSIESTIQAGVALCGLVILLTLADPFVRLDPAPLTGQGGDGLFRGGLPIASLAAVFLTLTSSRLVAGRARAESGRKLAAALRPLFLLAWLALTLALMTVALRGTGAADPFNLALLLIWLSATVMLHFVRTTLHTIDGNEQFLDTRASLTRFAPALLAALAALLASVMLAPSLALTDRLGLIVGVALLPASLIPLLARPIRRPSLAGVAAAIAHLGAGLSLLGLVSGGAFATDRTIEAVEGQRILIGSWLVEFRGIAPRAGPNWTALEAELRASRGSGVTILSPQVRTDVDTPLTRKIVTSASSWNGRLEADLASLPRTAGPWSLHLVWRPFESFILIGEWLLALGVVLALAALELAHRRARRLIADDQW